MSAPPLSRRGRPRDPRRQQQVLETAIRHFQANGFERTSLEAIARDSGVSKVTIYSYFPSKEALYEAALCARTDADMGKDIFAHLDPARPSESLLRIGRQFLKLMRADEVIGKHRTIYGEATQQPALSRIFYDSGPRKILDNMGEFLRTCIEAGSLRVADVPMAAEQFLSLFLGDGHIRAMLGLGKPSAEQDERLVQASVALFMKGYGLDAKP